MSIWEFINNFLYGLITGGSLALLQHDMSGDHPSYATAWMLGAILGAVASVSVLVYLLYPYK
jgi:hypothetical protein